MYSAYFSAGLLLICLHNAHSFLASKSPDQKSDYCESPIYCGGELLETVQLGKVFNDSKTFVDLYQKHDPSVTQQNFKTFMKKNGPKPTHSQLKKFVDDNFELSSELIDWTPPDMRLYPPIISKIQDPTAQIWLSELNHIWKILARKMSPQVLDHPERHSFIPVEHGFIVPGGRFQEFYYWDSYWTIEGLLSCGMYETAKGMILNFVSMVQRFGFIPNGGRVYYLMRSQPPLLIPMIEKYVEVTGDVDIIYENLHILEKEFAYFQREKTFDVTRNGRTYKMARYYVKSDGPRPESYREDYESAQQFTKEADKQEFYENMKAAAESGWDFSSRWFITDDFSIGKLKDISTKNIIPVDLNAFLQRNARLLSQYNKRIGKTKKAKFFKNIADQYQQGIDEVLWNEEAGTWFDYDTKHSRPRKNFYPTNLTPLYTKSFNKYKSIDYAQRTVNYLEVQNISKYMGGTPASLSETGQQWDAPNAWPPLQSILIQGLHNTNEEPALSLSRELATRWLKSNYLGFSSNKQMFEKYDSTNPGKYGGGGEYTVQEGFGWTNGVVFELFETFPDISLAT